MFLCFGKLKHQKMFASHCYLEGNIPRYTRYRANYENHSYAKQILFGIFASYGWFSTWKVKFHWKNALVSNMMSLPHPWRTMDVPCLCTFKNIENHPVGFLSSCTHMSIIPPKKPTASMTRSTDSHNRKPSYSLVLQIPFQEVFRPPKPAQNTLSQGFNGALGTARNDWLLPFNPLSFLGFRTLVCLHIVGRRPTISGDRRSNHNHGEKNHKVAKSLW